MRRTERPPQDPAPPTHVLLPNWLDGPLCASCGFCGWGRKVVGLPLLTLPPSPFSASPSACRFSAFLVVPVPWPLGTGPVAQEPGVGHYVGRPLAFRELPGPRWTRPAPGCPPPPQMGEVCPRCRPSLPSPPPRSPPLRFVLRLSGGSSTGLGGVPQSSGSDHSRMECAAAWGVPPFPLCLGSCLYLAMGDSSFLLQHAMR